VSPLITTFVPNGREGSRFVTTVDPSNATDRAPSCAAPEPMATHGTCDGQLDED
jgi:hypothetical protein